MFVLHGSGQGSLNPSWSCSFIIPGPGPCFPVSRIKPVLLQSLRLQPHPLHVLCSRSLHPSKLTADGIMGVVTASGAGPVVWLLDFCQSNYVIM